MKQITLEVSYERLIEKEYYSFHDVLSRRFKLAVLDMVERMRSEETQPVTDESESTQSHGTDEQLTTTRQFEPTTPDVFLAELDLIVRDWNETITKSGDAASLQILDEYCRDLKKVVRELYPGLEEAVTNCSLDSVMKQITLEVSYERLIEKEYYSFNNVLYRRFKVAVLDMIERMKVGDVFLAELDLIVRDWNETITKSGDAASLQILDEYCRDLKKVVRELYPGLEEAVTNCSLDSVMKQITLEVSYERLIEKEYYSFNNVLYRRFKVAVLDMIERMKVGETQPVTDESESTQSHGTDEQLTTTRQFEPTTPETQPVTDESESTQSHGTDEQLTTTRQFEPTTPETQPVTDESESTQSHGTDEQLTTTRQFEPATPDEKKSSNHINLAMTWNLQTIIILSLLIMIITFPMISLSFWRCH
uniref:Uncharacterized protein n=1 Tax=Trichobilharzia regenti TaxID=157069 RepID=A0AA85J0F1_TRIRE|nr:unnamed protein product [Trichobilharzia regenti]